MKRTTGSTPPDPDATAGDEGVVDKAKESAAEAKDKALSKGAEVQQQAQTKVVDTLDERKGDFTGKARGMEDSLRDVASTLREKDQDMLAGLVDRAVESFDGAVTYFEDKPVQEIATDLRQTAQRHPVTFVAGMFGLGFAIARAVKPASTPTQQSFDSSGMQAQVGTPRRQVIPASTTPPRTYAGV